MLITYIGLPVFLIGAFVAHFAWKRGVLQRQRGVLRRPRQSDSPLRQKTKLATLKGTSGQRLRAKRRQYEEERFRRLVGDVWPETKARGQVMPAQQK